MIQEFSESKKEGFLRLGELYFKRKEYAKATDAFMKTIIMGTHKDLVKSQGEIACNILASEAEDPEEAGRWRELLINFFS